MGGTTTRTERGLPGAAPSHDGPRSCTNDFRPQRFTPQFLLMRLRHATTAQDDLSETLASSFVRSTSSEPAGTLASGKEVDEFVKEFRELRKTYHKRVMWGDQWTVGRVAWRDDHDGDVTR